MKKLAFAIAVIALAIISSGCIADQVPDPRYEPYTYVPRSEKKKGSVAPILIPLMVFLH